MDELERLGMYEKGLLTDEEFATMKKKLIEGD
ncbi:SHOCT domain-containing protein [uncultured Methanobrevibacter sp.]